MASDKGIGAIMLLASTLGMLIYIYLIMLYPLLILQITAVIAVIGILGIIAWIGYTMVTTPPPPPIEEEPPAPINEDKNDGDKKWVSIV